VIVDVERVLGRRVREMRCELGWSQQEVASRMKASGHLSWVQNTVSKVEGGRRRSPVRGRPSG
jgi:hypothetical protein